MIIKQIILKNFGLYAGEHILKFNYASETQPITLIGGLNGRGKTTLLDGIILGLYGHRALKYLQDERIKYTRYLSNHINKSTSPYEETSITIVLADSETSKEQITIKRYWYNVQEEAIREYFDASRNNLVDEHLARNWDYFVEEILPLNISRFFFFDSEKISQIADDDSFESVKESIRALLGLTTIDQLISDMSKLIQKNQRSMQSNSQTDYTERFTELQARIAENEAAAKNAYDQAAHFQQLVSRDESRRDREQELFWAAGGNLGLDRKKISSSKEEHTDRLKSLLQQVQEYVQDPSLPLLMCPDLLSSTLSNAQQNERLLFRKASQTVLKQLRELLSGTDYSTPQKQNTFAFLDLAEQRFSVLTHTSQSVVFEMSADATYLLRRLIDSSDDRIRSLAKLLLEIHETEEILAQIEDHLSREVSESSAKRHWDQIQELNESIMVNEANRRVAMDNYDRLERERVVLERQRAYLLSENMQNAQSLGEHQRMVRYSAIVTETMNEFKRRIQAKKVETWQGIILRCFRSMVGKESMIQGIRIDPATLDIRLIDYAGGELLKTQLSAGEKQLFAVSILWGLAQCSGYDMPVIIDTPLGRLDSQHRINFVEGYLPFAGKQVIVLSTDEEINGRYLDLVKPYINSTYTLVYDEVQRSTSVVKGYFGGEVI